MNTEKRTTQRLVCSTAVALLIVLGIGRAVNAEVKLPSIFGEHMVLQQGQQNRVWGWADKGEKVEVTIAGQTHKAVANDIGYWLVKLDPLGSGGPYQMTLRGKNTITFGDVLVGEVWVCSGQSNMAWPVQAARDSDLEIRTANFPRIRLITVPPVGTQEPQSDFEGRWEVCRPETVAEFSAVGYFFGRQLHQTLNVPIGLIDNAWGGSACEAWIRRDRLEKDDRYSRLLARWARVEESYDHEQEQAEYQERLEAWRKASEGAKLSGNETLSRPRPPRNPLTGQHRPSNLYNGVLKPIIGYGIRGAIWYQGEANAERAYQYRHLFPLMIQNWRDEWKRGDFPFYWVQLADFKAEQPGPGESSWAELREAQTRTLGKLRNTGQAVIIDLGEGKDIHPKNKQDVAKRLARIALARNYGFDIAYKNPAFKSMVKRGEKIVLTFDHVGGGLTTFDVKDPIGFSIAGEERQFVWAKARILGKDQVEVWSDQVRKAVAVRYAWADNPVCNLTSSDGLPAAPFRTDGWPGITINNHE
ncbi:sialate O-acetylesterase [Acidobacteria bacterium AH-259-G07]|nr:sialate O-acetylesterase [Acidobacteria bacterium AH-259-G07]